MTTSIGDRLIQIRGHRSQAAFAKQIGVHKNTLGGYERGERTPDAEFLRKLMAAGYNANWVISGEGPMRLDGLSGEGKAKIDVELDAIEERLNRIEVPVTQEQLRENPELSLLKQRITRILGNPDATGLQRARADVFLSLAFQDKDAYSRYEQRIQDVKGRLRAARRTYEDAIKAVGYEPPPILAEALKTAIFVHGLEIEGVVILLEALKQELSTTYSFSK